MKKSTKCTLDCLNCTLPAKKCHGGDYRSALPYRHHAKNTTVGHGDARLTGCSLGRKIKCKYDFTLDK